MIFDRPNTVQQHLHRFIASHPITDFIQSRTSTSQTISRTFPKRKVACMHRIFGKGKQATTLAATSRLRFIMVRLRERLALISEEDDSIRGRAEWRSRRFRKGARILHPHGPHRSAFLKTGGRSSLCRQRRASRVLLIRTRSAGSASAEGSLLEVHVAVVLDGVCCPSCSMSGMWSLWN